LSLSVDNFITCHLFEIGLVLPLAISRPQSSVTLEKAWFG
jgi:hypothetical protein